MNGVRHVNKEIAASAISAGTSVAGIANSWWLWLTNSNAAHVVTMLTILLIVSQLIWGWRRFFKERS